MLKRKLQFTVLLLGIFLFTGAILPVTAFAQDYEDSPFGFIQGEVVYGQRPKATFLVDLGVHWNKGASGGVKFPSKDINDIDFSTELDFTKLDKYVKEIFIDNGINLSLPLMTFVDINNEEILLTHDQYRELNTVIIERYNGNGVDDMPGLKKSIKYWFVGGSEMNTGIGKGQDINTRKWKLSEAATAKYIKIGYDLIKSFDPEFKVLLGGSAGVCTWKEGDCEEDDKPKIAEDHFYYNLISEMTGEYYCPDMIFDYHKGSNPTQFKVQIETMNMVKETLTEFGYSDNDIWTTDCGGSWDGLGGFTEAEQAGDVVRRYAYTIANGQEKMYWTRVEEYNWPGVSMFDYMGLVHNPVNDPVGEEKDWKKLSYYTYKLMVEKIEGFDWDNVETIIDGTDYLYAYKFHSSDTNNANGPVCALWWAYFDDSGYSGKGDTIDVDWTVVTDANFVLITQAVPDANDGSELEPNDYPDFFLTETKPVVDGIVTVVLGESPVFIEEISNTSIEETGSITPNEFQLNQNYPNPFNPKTVISFQLSVFSNVTLKIYDVLGQEVRTLVNEKKSAGFHSVIWEGRDNLGSYVCSGVYCYYLKAGAKFSQTKKLLLIK
ncbi:T9SS type A sorting domain-containing protein [bacterium]|nr:T9SS type A sorting domain-containing protein [bacterium]MBU1635721.1 T9SS type A sorting domain-containing protein [bacterium]MBU1872634.1 T9SS type A sorting domain-containing protein [bacterium]